MANNGLNIKERKKKKEIVMDKERNKERKKERKNGTMK